MMLYVKAIHNIATLHRLRTLVSRRLETLISRRVRTPVSRRVRT